MESERPTIPVPEPRESGVRLQVAQLPICAATVDIVMCDLSRDPRSESYISSHTAIGGAPSRETREPSQARERSRTPRHSGLWTKDHDALAKCVDGPSQNERPPSTSTVLALK